MTSLQSLRNLGIKSCQMLNRAGINNAKMLADLGAARAYLKVKQVEKSASLNLLWALEGALSDRDWKDVANNDRLRLLLEVDALQRNS